MCGTNAGAGNHATCGSYFNAKTEDFPAVPYSGWDFNDGKCKSRSGDIENYHDISQVNLELYFSCTSIPGLWILCSPLLSDIFKEQNKTKTLMENHPN